MTNNYVIRNCPCYDANGDEYDCSWEYSKELYCQDCTDCVLKRIVELCGKYQVIDAGYQKVAINYLASDILKLLDIEEVE